MKKFLLGIITGLILAASGSLALLALGALDPSADAGSLPFEEPLANWARDVAVSKRAPDLKNPLAGDPAARLAGVAAYFEDCVLCHPVPGVAKAQYAGLLHPPAPALHRPRTQARSDGELFWIVKHGIRMSGMPAFGKAHEDERIWQIVTYLRDLPRLVAEAAKEGGGEPSEGPAGGRDHSDR